MSNPPVAVGFIVNSLRFGGAEKHTLQLFNGFFRRGFKTALTYLKREEHLLYEAEPASGHFWCTDLGKGFDIKGLIRLANWIRKFKPDILVCVNTYPLFYGHLARLLSGHRCRLISIFHSTELQARETQKMRLVYRHFFNHSDRIVYVSDAQRLYWEARGLRVDRGVTIHNGIDTQYFNDHYTLEEKAVQRYRCGFSQTDFVIGICAALRPEKKHEDLVDAIAKMKLKGVSVKCLIIGDGPRKVAIEEKIDALNLNLDIVISGFQTDVRPLISACDCMAIVSHQETFSIAALESMAMGKPMVISAIGGAAEQVRDGENGYLFPAGDVGALIVALNKLADKQKCAELGKNARISVVRDFSMETMLGRYAQVFCDEGNST